MVGGNTEVGRTVLYQLQSAREHADYTRIGGVFRVSAELAVELPIQLVRAVNEVNDHTMNLEGQHHDKPCPQQ